MGTLLFVYGTLKRGQRANHLLRQQAFRGEAHTAPRYRLYDAGAFPLLVEDSARGVAVTGEVWLVDDAVLERLDEWEEVPRLYVRRPITLEETTGAVWAYVFTGDATAYPDCGAQWPSSD